MHRLGIAECGAELRTNTDRYPQIRRDENVRTAKSVGRDPDHGVGLSVNLKRAADEIVAATLAFPKSVAGDHDCDIRVRFTFFGGVKATPERLDTHHREIVFRSQEGEATPHLVIPSNAGHGKLERGNIDKNFAAIIA